MENAGIQTPREVPDGRGAYPHFKEIPTRWMDNNPYRPITTNHRHLRAWSL